MYLENWDGVRWFHTDVYNWSPSIYRQYVYELDLLQWMLQEPLYAVVDNDAKLAKFGSKIGFEFLEQRQAVDGHNIDVYFRSK